jgi:hypothetical protein
MIAAAASVAAMASLAVAAPAARTSCPTASLSPALEAPRPGDVSLVGGRADCASLEVAVVAHGVEGLFTIAFDLRFPADLLGLEGHAPGPLLGKGDPRTPPLFLVRSPAPGRVEVSMTRFAPDGAVAAEGSETLLILRFSRLDRGTGPIDFGIGSESHVVERIVDDRGETVPARFGPGHGGVVTVP